MAGMIMPGRAVAALEGVVLVERLLHRVQLAVRGQALDRRDLVAVGLHGEHRARLHAACRRGARCTRRSCWCRSRRRCRSCRAARAGSGRAACGARRRRSSDTPSTVTLMRVMRPPPVRARPRRRATASVAAATSLWLDAVIQRCRRQHKGFGTTLADGRRHVVRSAPVGRAQRAASWWIGPSRSASRSPAAAPPQRDDLGGDRHGGLLRGARAEVEADRARQPGQLRRRSARPRAAAPAGPRGCAASPSRRRRRPRAAAARPRAAARRTSGRG